MPRPQTALANYIASDKEFRGIGVALATRLSEKFGRNLRDALAERDPGVIEVLGHEIAETAFAAFHLRSQETNLIEWFEAVGVIDVVGIQTAIRIARCWGSEGIEALRDNPYLLTAFLPWQTVEKVARKLAIGLDDPRRAAAAVEAVLYLRLDQNDTLVSEHDVEAGLAKLLNREARPAGFSSPTPIDIAVETGGACRLGNGLQPFGAAVMEEFVAQRISQRIRAEVYHDLLVQKADSAELQRQIAGFEAGQQYPLTEMQRQAIRTALTHGVMVLAGYAGSGKTTSLKGICDIAAAQGRKLYLMALSGKAAQRMAAATGRQARTIAGFLQPFYDAEGECVEPGALIIVDEASMLDLPTLWRIMKTMGDANLILVGDPAQLPPIGFGLTFHILCDTPGVPGVLLDKVMRQRAETGIPVVAEAIRHGRVPDLPAFAGAEPGVSFVESTSEEAIGIIAAIGKRLHADGAMLGETQIIAPVKSGPAGIAAINLHFHQARLLARSDDPFPGRQDIGGGDPIIWTRNDWDRELMNGSMGRLHSVIDGIGHATLDERPQELTEADAEYLDLAYAISVHKAQGSQWRRVIVPVFASQLLDRTLIYTAITRATEQVILVGAGTDFQRAVTSKPRSLVRNVGLAKRLQVALEL